MAFFDFFKIVYDEVFAVQLLAVSFSIVWVFYPWKKEKLNIIIGILHIVCAFAAGTVFNWLLFALSSVWSAIAGTHFHIAWLLTVFIYLGIFERKTYIASRILMGATLFISIISMAELGREVMTCLMYSFRNIYFDWICFLFSMLIVAFSFIMRRYTLKNYNDIPKLSVVMTMINTVAATFLIIFKTVLKMKIGFGADGFYCAVLAVIYVISVTGYMMIFFHCKMHRENTILTVQNKLLEADKQTLMVSEQAIEEMRALRHDMKNQHKVMGIMLEEGRYDELKNYFRSLSDKLETRMLSEFIDCGNQLMNSIVNMEILKATSYGVKLITKVNVPKTLPFEPSDICRVLVNIIDNAIEGILRTDKRDYMVDLKIVTRGDYLYACVQNEIRDDIDRGNLLKMNTSKDDAVYHGFGHKIVKQIVEKYNGYVNYSIAENEFIAEVMLEMDVGGGVLMNKELQIAVCDDDEIVCEAICVRITKFLNDCDISALCDKYTSPLLLCKNITDDARKYDVVFLDIDMPKLDGVELAKAIREAEKPIDIVFVSNREDKVFDALAVRPFGFIRKNNFTRDLCDTLRSYIKMRISDNSFVVLQTNNNSVTRSVRVSDIVYIESFRYKQYVYMADGEKIDIHMTMKELEQKLEGFDIIRVYQGYIVNFKYIQRIDRNEIILNYNGGTAISISREKVQELKGRYLKYLRKMGAVLFDGE